MYTGIFTPYQPLQIWFKWDVWEETTEEEYLEAINAAKEGQQ